MTHRAVFMTGNNEVYSHNLYGEFFHEGYQIHKSRLPRHILDKFVEHAHAGRHDDCINCRDAERADVWQGEATPEDDAAVMGGLYPDEAARAADEIDYRDTVESVRPL